MNLSIQKDKPEKVKENRPQKNILKALAIKPDTIEEVVNTEDAELLKTIMDARSEWLDTIANFEYASEEKLIDYYIYKMKACEERYTYFIMKAKEKGLRGLISQDLGIVCHHGEFNGNI